jgi:polar amino acid transport system permease protein
MTDLLTQMLPGIITALEIFALTLVFSIPLGIIFALGRLTKIKIIAQAVQFYIWVVRGTPLMLQLIFVYFGLGNEFSINRFVAVIITFVLNYAAYFAEIFRGGIQSIDRSQFESGEVLGLNYWQTFYWIILPQTIKRVLPPISNEVIALVKDTSLAQVIGIIEVFTIVRITAARDFVVYPFLVAAIFYLLMTYFITKAFELLEKRYAYYY